MPVLDDTEPTGVVTIADVELVRAGSWLAAAGDGNITSDDLDAILAASTDPEVDRPAVRIGHIDPRFDGEPALGWVENLRRDGDTILGDLTGVPAKLAEVMRSAFRRRSVELSEVETPSGKRYRRALRGLSLLGVKRPAVKGLADVLALYSTGELAEPGASVLLAEISLDEIRRLTVEAVTGTSSLDRYAPVPAEAYASELYTDHVIVELYEPTGPRYYRVDYEVAPDGTLAIGQPVEVARRYVPITTTVALSEPELRGYTASTAAGASTFRHTRPPATYAPPERPTPEERTPMAIDEARLRQLLGLSADADVEARVRQLVGQGGDPNQPDGTPAPPSDQPGTGSPEPGVTDPNATPAPAAQPDQQAAGNPADPRADALGLVTLSEGSLAELRAQASAGAAAAAELARQRREATLTAAVQQGRIAPAERSLFAAQIEKDEEGTTTLLAGLTPRFAVTELGSDHGADVAVDEAAWQEFDKSIGLG